MRQEAELAPVLAAGAGWAERCRLGWVGGCGRQLAGSLQELRSLERKTARGSGTDCTGRRTGPVRGRAAHLVSFRLLM